MVNNAKFTFWDLAPPGCRPTRPKREALAAPAAGQDAADPFIGREDDLWPEDVQDGLPAFRSRQKAHSPEACLLLDLAVRMGGLVAVADLAIGELDARVPECFAGEPEQLCAVGHQMLGLAKAKDAFVHTRDSVIDCASEFETGAATSSAHADAAGELIGVPGVEPCGKVQKLVSTLRAEAGTELTRSQALVESIVDEGLARIRALGVVRGGVIEQVAMFGFVQ